MSNPEFRRNLWIQFSSTRVLVGGLLTGLLLACALSLDLALTAQTKFDPTVLTYTARWVAISILIFWAGYQAAGAVVGEVRHRTWDAQRLSTIHPWSMAWGKLFGATSLAWTMALISALTYAVAQAYKGPSGIIAWVLGGVLGYGIVCQATGLLASLARLSGRPGERGGSAILSLVVGLLATALLAAYANWALENEGRWYGLRLGEEALRLVTIWFFALWAIIGVYRRMRRELQMRSMPWAWLLFLVTLVIYGEGLAFGRDPKQAGLLLPTLILMIMLWAMLLIEAKDPLNLRQCLGWFRAGQWGTALKLVPLWLVTYVVFAVVATISVVVSAASPNLRIIDVRAITFGFGVPPADTLLILVAAFLYLTRDVLIVQTLTLGREGHMAGVAGFGLWFVFYFAIPAVFIAGDGSHLLGLVLPTGQGGWAMCLLPIAAQVVGCIVLYLWRWRAFWRQNAAKAPV
jgi:hypothetical protein